MQDGAAGGWQDEYSCSRCGLVHAPRRCPAYNKTCIMCHRRGNFIRCYRQRSVNVVNDDGDFKTLLSTQPLLKFYDQSENVKISSDASKCDLGAVILQHDGEWQPVAYASRAMTSAETRYAQIEKELFSIMFACERFHQFIY